jgi:hypothetical protein
MEPVELNLPTAGVVLATGDAVGVAAGVSIGLTVSLGFGVSLGRSAIVEAEGDDVPSAVGEWPAL